MKYLDQIKTIVLNYDKIQQSLNLLEEQAHILNLSKNAIELQLAEVKESERLLIDKIKSETGEVPDFYKILQELQKRKYSVVDLEGLAHHKGSAYGAIGQPVQPSQEMFENILAHSLLEQNKNNSYPW